MGFSHRPTAITIETEVVQKCNEVFTCVVRFCCVIVGVKQDMCGCQQYFIMMMINRDILVIWKFTRFYIFAECVQFDYKALQLSYLYLKQSKLWLSYMPVSLRTRKIWTNSRTLNPIKSGPLQVKRTNMKIVYLIFSEICI